MVPGGLVGLGMLLIKESARWLAKRGRDEEALESLIWVQGEDTAEVRAEYAEILMGVQQELKATEGVTHKELLLPANRMRLFIAVTLQLCQQLTGNTSLAYYAPQIFAAVGAGTSNLLITGFFGIIKVISVLCFQVGARDNSGSSVSSTYRANDYMIGLLSRKDRSKTGFHGWCSCNGNFHADNCHCC